MKKIFTLIAMALMAVGANAESWRPAETAPAAGSAIIKGDLLKVNTVFETTCGKILDEGGAPAPVTFAGNTFETDMQIRVDKAPSADTPTGTEKEGSSPLVIVAKKNVDLTIYYRRQAESGTTGDYSENGGKDMKLIDQANPSSAIASASYEASDIDGSYGNVVRTYKLEEGKTYTLWARGTTGRLYGMDFVEGSGAGGGGGEVTGSEFLVTFNGKDEQPNGNYFSFGTGDNKHNFNNKFTDASWNGIDFTSGLKMEGSTLIQWTSTETATVTVVQSTWSEKGFYMDDVFYDPATAASGTGCRIYTIEGVAAGEHKITRTNSAAENAGESGMFAVQVTYTGGTGINSIHFNNVQNDAIYNLAGQKVNSGFKGIAIVNGKKVVLK